VYDVTIHKPRALGRAGSVTVAMRRPAFVLTSEHEKKMLAE
jgi:hypothetical protein